VLGGKPASAHEERAAGPRGALASWAARGENRLGRKGEKERGGRRPRLGRARGFFSYFSIFLFSYFLTLASY
jgi:hypothetical protein